MFSARVQQETKKNLFDKTKHLLGMKLLVKEVEGILNDQHSDLNEICRLSYYTWKLKRGIYNSIFTNPIDDIY